MAENQQSDSPYYTNSAYVPDSDSPYAPGSDYNIELEPGPPQFLPRIITGSEIGGQKSKPEVDSEYGIVGSPKSPRFQPPGSPPSPYANNGSPVSVITTNSPTEPDGAETGAGGDRDTWDNPLEFLLSCISMSVGLGNVWRFPSTAANNGGGAFLIPYLIVLLLIGRPLYYLEMCLGQFSRYGQVKVWNMAPIFKGVGYGSNVGVVCVVSYYVALMAITSHFFFSGFQKTLPWAKCHDDWVGDCEYYNQTEYAQNYFGQTVFSQLPNIDDGLGKLHWQLALCLVFSWLLIFLSLVKGVKSSGKVAYFTAIFPYVVLFILLIRGVTLKGAWKGIRVFLEPDWSKLYDPMVWYEAVSQCFFSLSAGFGPVIMFSSYNGFRQNVYKDALIISFLDTFTSLLAGITIFAVIGHLMDANDWTFQQIKDSSGGPGLAFILYPQAIASFTWAPQLFSFLFFFMLFTLGIGSATSLAGGVITIVCDQFPHWKRWLVTLVLCTAGCLVGMLYVNEGGLHMLDLVDHYGSGFVIYLMAIFECAGMSYIYGLNNFCNDIEFMLGRYTGIYWRACWGFILPVGLFANLLYYLINNPSWPEETPEKPSPYPVGATVAGWCLTGFAVAMIPIWGLHSILTRKADTFAEKFKLACTPTHRWGPQDPKLRKEWQEFKAMKEAEGYKFKIW